MDPADLLIKDFGLSIAIEAEIRRLKLEGHSKAYICERSLEIEDTIRARLGCPRAPDRS